jgi:hypothetical protein
MEHDSVEIYAVKATDKLEYISDEIRNKTKDEK